MSEGNLKKIFDAFGMKGFYRYDPDTEEKITKIKTEGNYTQIAELYPLNLTDTVEKNIHQILSLANAGIIREDLLLSLHALITRNKNEIEILECFKECINITDYQALLFANTLMNLEDNTFSDKTLALRLKFNRKYENHGKKLYNWLRSGYIKDFFHFKLCVAKYEYEHSYQEHFRDFFEKELRFFDQAIWTVKEMKDKDIVKEISVRLRERNDVNIYARSGVLVSRVTEVCSGFVRAHPEYGITDEGYSLGENRCIKITIFKLDLMRKK